MQQHNIKIEKFFLGRGSQSNSLRSRADEVLIAIAILGLSATIADGEADSREIDTFTRELRKRFALSERHSLKLMKAALSKIKQVKHAYAIDCACDTLNEHLDLDQKLRLFDGLADILVADDRLIESEEFFLDYIGGKLGLLDPLE